MKVSKEKNLWFAGGVVILLLVIVLASRSAAPTPAPADSTPQGSPATETPKTGGTAPKTTYTPPKPVITLLSPAADAQWVFGQPHIIQWSKEANAKGHVYLVDAATQTTVGTINPSTEYDQTMTTWNTRDVLLSRTDPRKKEIAPGRYIITVKFDAAALPVLSSPAFSVLPAQ